MGGAFSIPFIFSWQNILLGEMYLHFETNLQEKTSVYTLKPCREIGQSFEESLRGGKHVKNLEIF